MQEVEKTVNQKLESQLEILDNYGKSIGLNSIKFNNDVEKILELSLEEIRTTSIEDSLTYSYALARYSGFLQKECNRHSSKLKWANHNLSIIVGKLYNNYGDKWTKLEERKIQIINDNDAAQSLNKIILENTLKLEELQFISTRINTMSNILLEYQKTKRSERYERGS